MSQVSLDIFYGRGAAENEGKSSEKMQKEGEETKPSPEAASSRLEARAARRIIRNPDGTIDEIFEAQGRPKIIIHRRPGVRAFREHVKCPLCNAYFATDYDLQCHVKTHWKPLRSGGGEWIPSEAAPDLGRALLNAEFIVKGRYEYRFAAEGRIIIRRPRSIF